MLKKLCQFFETEDAGVIETQGRFQFAIKQLKLATKEFRKHRYSPTLLVAASLWESTSPAF